MPTGYTAGVQDGTITTFNDFAMLCAKAFGACVMMRDEPLDKAIPEFEPSQWHAQELVKAQVELVRLEGLTYDSACDLANAEHADAVTRWQQRKEDKDNQRRRYEVMLAATREWTPPSSDHQGLKDFMIKQLEESIEFDCSMTYDTYPELVLGEDWRKKQITAAKWSIDCHTRENQAEIDRVASRNKWVRQLRESLVIEKAVA